MSELEMRHMTAEIRSEGEEGSEKVSGLGIVYNKWEEIYPGYRERIKKGAVIRNEVVKSYFNHSGNMVLATTESDPPLELKDTNKGLEYTAPIPPTSYGNDLKVNLSRGNVKGSSFAFNVPEDGDKRWEEDGIFHREIKKLNLFEIGPVTDPAYLGTSANLRRAEEIHNEFLAMKSQEDEVANETRRKACQEEAERKSRYRDRKLKLLEYEVM